MVVGIIVYSNGKIHSTKLNMVPNQIFWFPKSPRYSRKGRADKPNADNALVCKFHFNPIDINILLKKAKGL